jgi:hypothetical protein
MSRSSGWRTLARPGAGAELSGVVVTVVAVPSITHEMLVELIRNRPSLVPELLGDVLGVDLPAHEQVRLESADCTAVAPAEYRADAVVVLKEAGRPVLAVVVEVQLQRDGAKRRSWPVYMATLHARWACPTVLLVVCVDPGVAAWCAQPIQIGPGWRGVPLVLGPDRVPVLTSLEQTAGVPELAVLSALAHGGTPVHRKVIDVLVEALSFADVDRAISYAGYVLAALPQAAHAYLEALMKTETYAYQSGYARSLLAQGRTEGRTEAKAADVLMVLDTRGMAVTDEARTRITKCSDLDQLDLWLRRAVTAASVAELFD